MQTFPIVDSAQEVFVTAVQAVILAGSVPSLVG